MEVDFSGGAHYAKKSLKISKDKKMGLLFQFYAIECFLVKA